MSEINFDQRWRDIMVGNAARSSDMQELRQDVSSGKTDQNSANLRLNKICRYFDIESCQDSRIAFYMGVMGVEIEEVEEWPEWTMLND